MISTALLAARLQATETHTELPATSFDLLALCSPHWPVLVVIVPFIGGLLSVFMGKGFKPWLWANVICLLTLSATIELLIQVLSSPNQIVRYALGDWKAPWGIEYVVDPLNGVVLLVVAAIATVVTFASRSSIQDEIPADRHNFFYSMWLLCITGLLGMAITGDAFNVYVLLELASLTIYALIAMGKFKNRRALTATINYLVLGSIGASFILIGIGYLYMVTGTLNMADIGAKLPYLLTSTTVHAAFAFLIVGLCIKMALFPLHQWLPNAYTYAPSAVTALLAATATKVGIYLAIRFFYDIFGAEFSFKLTTNGIPNGTILLSCGALAIVFGSMSAVRQINLKTTLAYSSVAQIGYIVVGFALINQDALTGSIVHIMNHALIKGGMFLALSAVVLRVGGSSIHDLKGLGRRMPLTMAALVVGGLGLVGVPLTAGFVSKWYLVLGAIRSGHWEMAAIMLAGSLFALYYVWRMVEVIYFRDPISEKHAQAKEAPIELLIGMWTLLGASIYFGINSTLTSGLAHEAATQLLNRGGQ